MYTSHFFLMTAWWLMSCNTWKMQETGLEAIDKG